MVEKLSLFASHSAYFLWPDLDRLRCGPSSSTSIALGTI
jgi:hypothetical protein